MPLADLLAEVDHLISVLDSAFLGTGDDSVSTLAAWISNVETLRADHTRGTLRLSDCDGHVITEWSVPGAFLELVAGGTQ
jgi:hypothetical protein